MPVKSSEGPSHGLFKTSSRRVRCCRSILSIFCLNGTQGIPAKFLGPGFPTSFQGQASSLSKSLGAPSGVRTRDPWIKSPLLCQLSYRGEDSLVPVGLPCIHRVVAWQAWGMGELDGLLWALVIGLFLLALAVWLDMLRRRRLEGESTGGGDEGRPEYLTQSEIDDLPAPAAGETPDQGKPRGERLEIGLAALGFADAHGRAELEDASVLIIDGTGVTMRELMEPIAQHQPIVLVARGIGDEVLATLVANRKSLRMPVVAVVTDLIPEVADLTGALPVPVADLKAGYLPTEHLGHVTSWTTDRSHTWIEPYPPLVGA